MNAITGYPKIFIGKTFKLKFIFEEKKVLFPFIVHTANFDELDGLKLGVTTSLVESK